MTPPFEVHGLPRTLADHIFLLGSTFEDTLICDLTESYLAFSGWTWAEVDAYWSEQRRYLKAKEQDNLQAQVAAQTAIRRIVSGAEDRRKENGAPDVTQMALTQGKQQVTEGQHEAKRTVEMVGANSLPHAPMPALLPEDNPISERQSGFR